MAYKLIFCVCIYCLALFSFSCSQVTTLVKDTPEQKYVKDEHSYAEPNLAIVKHLEWKATVDFENKIIFGIASLHISKSTEADKLILDTKNLNIKKVTLDNGEETDFFLGQRDKILGTPLVIQIKPNTTKVNVEYATKPGAEALQWLEPVQTAGGDKPFLFTQSQAILARSWIPLQDSPGIRFTYEATVKVPVDLLALMSAENPQSKNDKGIYSFTMEQPIPAYLMALTVGDVEFKSVGPRTGVYAEPNILDAAVYEFAEMEDMLSVAEKLYGPYKWGRYDLIVLPPSFPFGGMENPRLTFATPTILAGDRSLTSLVAHELAHSWSGNLVTNATWDDFWLNEGFTVYFERRIMEEVYDKSYAEMLAALGYQDLVETVEDLESSGKGEDTRLKLDLSGRDPDEGVSDIAYEKGYFFLKNIEDLVGREKFDDFLKNYFENYSFQSIDTESFILYIKKNLFEKNNLKIDSEYLTRWIYTMGLPHDIKNVASSRFQNVIKELQKFESGSAASEIQTNDWSSHEWLHFIRNLSAGLSYEKMEELDREFNLSNSGNSEILTAWFQHVISQEYTPAYSQLESFLTTVGRRKFLVPLYKELAKTPQGIVMAKKIYKKARPNYHYVSTNTLDELFGLTD